MAGELFEETVPNVRGEVVAVPVPKVSKEIYINAGLAQGASIGDKFLVLNSTVRVIALVEVTGTQDRMSNVTILAQLAAIRVGDKVKRISAVCAAGLRKKMEALGGFVPTLDSPVAISPEMLALSGAVGVPRPAGTVAAAPLPVVAGPDLSDVMLLVKAGEKGMTISWNAPAGPPSPSGYILLRAGSASEKGNPLNTVPLTALSWTDNTVKPGVPYVYRLVAFGSGESQSAKAPSIEATWTAPKKGTLGLGGAPSKVKVRSLPAFVITAPAPAAAATAVPPAPGPAPALAPTPPPAAATATPPAPAPPPAPTPPPAATAPPSPALPPAPTPPPAAAAPAPTPPPAPAPAPTPASTPPPAAQPAPVAEAPLPAPPTRVAVSLEGPTAVVKWNPAAAKSPIAGYTIFRAFPGDEAGAPLNGTPLSDTVYKDRGVKQNTTYEYWVCTQGADGRMSKPSNKVRLTVPGSSAVPFF